MKARDLLIDDGWTMLEDLGKKQIWQKGMLNMFYFPSVDNDDHLDRNCFGRVWADDCD